MAKKAVDKSLRDAAKVLKAAGHPARLAIVESLLEGAKTVGDIQSALGLSQPNLSQHLALLKRVGLIQSYASGPLRCYYLIRPSLALDLLSLARRDHKAVEASKERIVAQATGRRPRGRKKTATPKAGRKRATGKRKSTARGRRKR
jgi:ArsR family transcriptional regulator